VYNAAQRRLSRLPPLQHRSPHHHHDRLHPPLLWLLGFSSCGLGLGVQGLGLGVRDSGFGGWGLGFEDLGLWFGLGCNPLQRRPFLARVELGLGGGGGGRCRVGPLQPVPRSARI